MEYIYDVTTGELKIDFQTNLGKVIKIFEKPLENYTNIKSFVVKSEDLPLIKAEKAENISQIIMSSDDIKNMLSLHIKDYQILCPGKVVRVDFTDNTSEKMVLKDPDVFDIRRCLFIAIAKHLYKDTYTPEGIEHKATLLSYEKKYAKIVDSAIKNHEKKEKEKLLKLQKEKEEKERIKRKRAKNLKRREQLRKKRIEEQINIQKEVIIRVNDEKRK